MQKTHDTNGDGLAPFPKDVPVANVNVYMHDSGMLVTHDYSCPCCRSNHAVLDLSTGLMQPCRTCEKEYHLVRINRRRWWQILIGV